MANLLLSIIIPNFNGRQYLSTCFEALQRQTYPYLEIILVDNGSSDDSLILTRQSFPSVRILALGKNFGFAGAVNRGIEQATGDIIIALNNDTEADPNWAQALVERFEAFPDAGIVASKMLLFNDRKKIHSAGDAFGCDGIPINRGVWQMDKGQFDADTYIFGGCGGAAAYRRGMLADIGLFDEDLFMYLEDVDLNWRAQLAGYRVVFAPQAVVYHHLSATGGGVISSYYTGRNTLFVLVKNLPTSLIKKYWPKIVKAQLKITFFALKAWRGEAARARLRGQVAGLWGLPRWWAKRGTVQRCSSISDAYVDSLLTKT